MPSRARSVVFAVAIITALAIGFTALNQSDEPASGAEQLDELAATLPEPGPDARLISNEIDASEANIVYRLPLASDPAVVAQKLAAQLEDQGWSADEPRLIDASEGSTGVVFIATRSDYKATVRATSEPTDFTVTITVTPTTPQASS